MKDQRWHLEWPRAIDVVDDQQWDGLTTSQKHGAAIHCHRRSNWRITEINGALDHVFRRRIHVERRTVYIQKLRDFSEYWIDELRYIGLYLVNSRTLKCCLDAAKRGFYRAVNSIFGKGGRIASEVVLHLTTSKCMPILLYGLEALPLNKTQLSSLV